MSWKSRPRFNGFPRVAKVPGVTTEKTASSSILRICVFGLLPVVRRIRMSYHLTGEQAQREIPGTFETFDIIKPPGSDCLPRKGVACPYL